MGNVNLAGDATRASESDSDAEEPESWSILGSGSGEGEGDGGDNFRKGRGFPSSSRLFCL